MQRMMASMSLLVPSLKVQVLPSTFSEQRHLGHSLGPLEAHGAGAMREGDRLGAVLVALDADVLGRVARSDAEHILAGEARRRSENRASAACAREARKPWKFGDVRNREVSAGDEHVVELFRRDRILDKILDGNGELAVLSLYSTHFTE